VLEKGKWQGAGLSNSLHAAFNCCDNFVEIFGASINHLLPFNIFPECLKWVQIRRVAWQSLLAEPTALSGQVLLHHLTLVRRQPVPHQDGLLAAQVSSGRRDEGDVDEFDDFRPPDSIFWIDLTTAEVHTPQVTV